MGIKSHLSFGEEEGEEGGRICEEYLCECRHRRIPPISPEPYKTILIGGVFERLGWPGGHSSVNLTRIVADGEIGPGGVCSLVCLRLAQCNVWSSLSLIMIAAHVTLAMINNRWLVNGLWLSPRQADRQEGDDW